MLLSGDVSRPAGDSITSHMAAYGDVTLDPSAKHGASGYQPISPDISVYGQHRQRGQHMSRTDVHIMAPADSSFELPVADAYNYCRQIAQQIARTFYYGSLFLPMEKRRATWALYAFCRTADDIADEPDLYPNPMRELARWRAALGDAYKGQPRGPVMTAWTDMLGRFAVPITPALDLLDGVAMDISGTRYKTFDDLRLYCYRVAGTVGLLMSPVLGYEGADTLDCAVNLGIAMQLTNILRDIGEDAANGRIYIPDEDLARFGYSREQLLHGIINDNFLSLMEFEMARAEEYYERGMRGVRCLSRESRLAIALSSALYRGILNRIRRNQYDVFSQRAHISLPGKVAALPGIWLRQRFGASA